MHEQRRHVCRPETDEKIDAGGQLRDARRRPASVHPRRAQGRPPSHLGVEPQLNGLTSKRTVGRNQTSSVAVPSRLHGVTPADAREVDAGKRGLRPERSRRWMSTSKWNVGAQRKSVEPDPGPPLATPMPAMRRTCTPNCTVFGGDREIASRAA